MNDQTKTSARLSGLRDTLARAGVDGFLVPHTDEHQSEYLPACAERLAWLTGFTGSAGNAVVLRGNLQDRAAIFVDGRYTLQAANEVDDEFFEICHISDISSVDWLAEAASDGGIIGYDPWLHTRNQLRKLADTISPATLQPMVDNPIDGLWEDQPAAPSGPITAHEVEFSGQSFDEKSRRIADSLLKDGDRAVILTNADSIAWLFNIRGTDVDHTPVALCFASLETGENGPLARLFIDSGRVNDEVSAHLGERVMQMEPGEFARYLDSLGAEKVRIRLCPNTGAAWIYNRLESAGAVIHEAGDPCTLPKAIKNEIELAGTRAAHIRDGVAVTRFLAWLDAQPAGSVDEIGAADRLETQRREDPKFRDLSFTTISGAGSNGAIVHYRVNGDSNAVLEQGLYLVDSGAQYPDGTTDITRTVAIGAPSDEMRRHFTLVLKGHIALASCRFPKGSRGSQLDPLARQFLWQAGLDYDHGTGHGVGSYLAVHEGPHRIAKVGSDAPLIPGMVVSNEPGYYLEGAYGIRIENLLEVVALDGVGQDGRVFYGLNELTRAPLDRRLIAKELLTAAEISWVDKYHARVWADIEPHLKDGDRTWLMAATDSL